VALSDAPHPIASGRIDRESGANIVHNPRRADWFGAIDGRSGWSGPARIFDLLESCNGRAKSGLK
jgi:hypothetical protein